MEFKKCLRCGTFFMSDNDVCCNCQIKDRADISILNNFIDENIGITSAEDLSIGTGITTNNINRFIANNSLPNINFKL